MSKSLLIIFLLFAFTRTQDIEDRKVVCYYTSWSVYRTNQFVFKPSQINPFLCTHLIYAFGAFDKDNKIKPFDEFQDKTRGGYKEVTNIKSFNKDLKVLLAMGGGREGSKNFSPISGSAERRSQFSKNLLKYLRDNNFDGVSLDWQYPAFKEGSRPEDKENYVELVKALQNEFTSEAQNRNVTQLLISITVPAREEYIERGYDLENLQKFADVINLAAYDYHYPYEPAIYHHSPLYPLPEEVENHPNSNLNVDGTIKFIKNKGANLSKYTLGIAAYGRTFKLQNPAETDLGAASKAEGNSGSGIRAYYDVCSYMKDNRWTVKTPNATAMGPYAFRGEDWVSFDDEEIVKRKAEYSVEIGLGGLMYWTLDNDDFRGDCSGRTHPLIKAGREGLESGLNRLKAATSTTTEPPTTEANVIPEIIAMDQSNDAGIKSFSGSEVPSLRANISAIANKSASLAADILNLSNFSTTVLLDNSAGGERLARLDSIVLKEQKMKNEDTIHTFQPQYGLELGGKLNQSHFYSIKIWIINNLFNF